jgi:hypothetical protein
MCGKQRIYNPFKIRTYRKFYRNSFRMSTSKNQGVGYNGSFDSPNQTRERLTEYGLADLRSPSGAPCISTGNLC